MRYALLMCADESAVISHEERSRRVAACASFQEQMRERGVRAGYAPRLRGRRSPPALYITGRFQPLSSSGPTSSVSTSVSGRVAERLPLARCQ
jgi:hypothetical protein